MSWFLYYVFVIMAAHEYYNVNQFISQSAASNGTDQALENDQTGFMSKPAVKITQVVLKEMISDLVRDQEIFPVCHLFSFDRKSY